LAWVRAATSATTPDGHGTLLAAIDTGLALTRTLTWQSKPPVVALVTTPYETGVKAAKDALQRVEAQLKRLPGLEKWLVDIVPPD
jgi:hypothetical protein